MNKSDNNQDNYGDPQDDQGNEEVREFEEMMRRWGITAPDEVEETYRIPIEYLIAEWSGRNFKRPARALESLRNKENCSEAAAALFGYCYSWLTPFDRSVRDQLEERKAGVEPVRTEFPDHKVRSQTIRSAQEEIELFADLLAFSDSFLSHRSELFNICQNDANGPYIEVMLTAAYTLLTFSGNKQYSPYIDDLLADAYRLVKDEKVLPAEQFMRDELIDDGYSISGKVDGFLACLANGVICNSYAHIVSELAKEPKRDYLSAFAAFVSATEYMDKLAYDLPLPFTGYPYGDEELERVLKAWEQVKKEPPREKLRELRYKLAQLYDFICDGGMDGDVDTFIPDGTPGFVYFPRQFEFCESRMGQKEIHCIIDDLEEQQHERRMKTDFFEGLWGYLEPETQRSILQAEREWYDGQRIVPEKSAFYHYGLALETELHAIVFGRSEIQRCIAKMLADSETKKRMRLSSKEAQTLYLSDMSKLLYYVGENKWPDVIPIKGAINNLRVGEKEQQFLTHRDFTRDLGDIYGLRSAHAHRYELDRAPSLNDLRRRILGIGCEGYLPRLAKIKRHLVINSG